MAALGVSPVFSFASRAQGWIPRVGMISFSSVVSENPEEYLDFLGPCRTHDQASARPAQKQGKEASATKSLDGGIVWDADETWKMWDLVEEVCH